MRQNLALFILAGWTVVSLLLHLTPLFPPRIQRALECVSQLDPFSVFTTWNLFAPRPAPGNFHLLIRHRLPGGGLTPWRELPLTEERRLRHGIWHPRLRAGAALQGFGAAFCEPPSVPGGARMLSLPYLALLNHVHHQPAPAHAEAVQFLVALTLSADSEQPPQPLFVSGMHPVARWSGGSPGGAG